MHFPYFNVWNQSENSTCTVSCTCTPKLIEWNGRNLQGHSWSTLRKCRSPPVLLMAQRPVFYRKTSTFRQKSASKNLFRLCEEGLEITNLVHLYFLLYVCTKVIWDLKIYIQVNQEDSLHKYKMKNCNW